MASSNKTTPSLALFFCLNILFFPLVTAHQPVNPTFIIGDPFVGSSIFDAPSPSGSNFCPKNVFQIAYCAAQLNPFNLFPRFLPPFSCCLLIRRLSDPEAVACLCNAIKSNVVNISIRNRPMTPNRILNACSRNDATNGSQCP
ncbi:putative lipid-binding protein AIR1B [Cucumis sativus]|uniref:Hydrophobic seed protein domain-containing protein n=1 Tax=Cucumis sativus TaxID=3659 RepID=A0A0A0L6Y3_CUCSA|nr:putative lipid-binding protein AIR1B [Cucumis sativus]